MIRIDESEMIIYSDGSVKINTARKRLLCLDFSEILFLFTEASRLRETNRLETRSELVSIKN